MIVLHLLFRISCADLPQCSTSQIRLLLPPSLPPFSLHSLSLLHAHSLHCLILFTLRDPLTRQAVASARRGIVRVTPPRRGVRMQCRARLVGYQRLASWNSDYRTTLTRNSPPRRGAAGALHWIRILQAATHS